ncbi:hypothetical protein SCHPADRAFT_893558 [Schizopora paradoxa]|uniref:Uncharacterized protein n=1 Tax=Schizopora paradoxa TaxID=27342 RepID=A0A0H2RAF2_9AGAM|nr:hypothetical protein SCHPADRAFT_893558 [Schizopora paradoxa]
MRSILDVMARDGIGYFACTLALTVANLVFFERIELHFVSPPICPNATLADLRIISVHMIYTTWFSACKALYNAFYAAVSIGPGDRARISEKGREYFDGVCHEVASDHMIHGHKKPHEELSHTHIR